MNQYLIKKYINKLTKQDIINYLNSQNIFIKEKDINIIYYYIKRNKTKSKSKDLPITRKVL